MALRRLGTYKYGAPSQIGQQLREDGGGSATENGSDLHVSCWTDDKPGMVPHPDESAHVEVSGVPFAVVMGVVYQC